ncbi:Two-component response regulator [Desulfamplus magnetovallimortis]|uniref:Two-component response regulator n=1 Tax=Desulfamplus magnetovallimortis TaxID=1246637 RepID=A0A1W1H508_9BACT|nr:response regulator transcription factor [Desulfamplus magnetovallimortis]SLM27534.1 Two-component response regulator [Desulfamplus magnetovallimortis]
MENGKKKRILVIEDEAHIAEGIELNLAIQGYDVQVAPDGVMGLEIWRSWSPDLIVLDVMLPMIDGFSVLRTIRADDEKLPVLILSAKSSVEDKVHGLRCGVDDYLAKPFDLDEFLLRVKRLIARGTWSADKKMISPFSGSESSGAEEVSGINPHKDDFHGHSSSISEPFSGDSYSFGENTVNFITCEALGHGGKIVLTEQEIKLLKLFIANRGRPVSRKDLLEAGWGYSSDTSTRTLDNFMVRFRKYFEKNPRKPQYFKSRRSVGYIFEHDN